jgi:hypothetical protein
MPQHVNKILASLYTDLTSGKEPNDLSLQEVITYLRSQKNLVYGAGRSGIMLGECFRALDIPLARYVDRNFANIGSVHGIEVKSPDSLRGMESGDGSLLIIAAGTMQLSELIEKDIEKLGCPIPAMYGLYLVYLLQFLVCRRNLEKGIAPKLSTCTTYHVKPYRCPLFCRHVESISARETGAQAGTGSTFNEFGYLLSEVCTLQCKHCLEAVPYLPGKEILPRVTVLQDIRKMAEACRFIHRLDLVGGEPFLYPDFHELVADIRAMERIGYIGVFTNGTVVPDDALCRALSSERIIVTVANYGETLSEKLRAGIELTLERLREHGIQYFHYSDRYWFDINSFTPNNLPDQQLAANYANCFLAACRRMYDGRLYHCPYQCNGVKLGKFESGVVDYLDIRPLSIEKLARELDRFDQAAFIDACRYCSIPTGAAEVTAGEQLT